MNDPDLPSLRTPRLLLRRFTEADVQTFLAYRSDPAVMRYQGWESCDLARATEFIRHHPSQEAGVPGQWLQIAIALKETNALLGDCALKIQAHDPRQATIGVTLARQNHGQGFATEALSCLLDQLFDRLKLHRRRQHLRSVWSASGLPALSQRSNSGSKLHALQTLRVIGHGKPVWYAKHMRSAAFRGRGHCPDAPPTRRTSQQFSF